MQPEEIKQMFLAASALRRCKSNDPDMLSIKCTVDNLTKRYIAENVLNDQPNENQAMDINEAMNIIGVSLNSLTQLEIEHRPDGLTDSDIKDLAIARKTAIETVVNTLLDKHNA